jgi:hypothetical protein
MCGNEFALDGTEPIISIKRLSGIAEDWRSEAYEVPNTALIILTVSGILLYTLKKPHIVSTIWLVHGHQLDHGWWRRKIDILLGAISMTVTMATSSSSTMRYSGEKQRESVMDSKKT